LVALPGGRNFGAVSVRVAYFATAVLVGRVPAGVFWPRPNVESVLVELVRRERPAVDPSLASYAEIDLLVRAGFGGRRKMLRRSLDGLVDATVFAAAGIDGRSRAEELGVQDWGKLVACRRSIECGHPPS
jgi:16S rRNA (adenine1518-N6/adenine1519-N6)-dimethyltransferase